MEIYEKAKLGSGARFKALKKSIASKGEVRDPGAVAAAIGRKKYGKAKFQKLAAKGHHENLMANVDKLIERSLLTESAAADQIVEHILDYEQDTESGGYPPQCPQCGGEGTLLGALGHTRHYRCRQCGWDFHSDNDDLQGQFEPTDEMPPPKACMTPRPKADLMPGGSMGPVGDTTAIGIPGGGN